MEGHIQKGVIKGLFNYKNKQNKIPCKWLIIILIICLLVIMICFINFSTIGNVILESNEKVIAGTTAVISYDSWFLGESNGTLQVDYVAVQPEQPLINDTIYCINGSISKDVSSLYYLWYINGTLNTKLNTSTIVSGYPSANRNFTVYDQIQCGIVPQNESNLVAYWPFDEGSGVAFKDIINNNSGAIIYADWKPGRDYYSVNISLTNNYTIISPSRLNLTQNFTYEIWFYPTTIAQYTLIDNAGVVYITINQSLARGYLKINEASASQKIIAVNTITLNRWNHIALTYDNRTIALYLNGVLENSTNLSGHVDDFSGDLIFGRSINNVNEFLRGQIDEVAIYNKSLSTTEISNHFKRGIAILSKDNTLLIDAKEEDFLNGTFVNMTYSSTSGGLILTNCSSNVYCGSGEFVSKNFTIYNQKDKATLITKNVSLNEVNARLLIRTGTQWDNGSIIWTEYSPFESAYINDSDRIFSLPFSEGEGNTTIDLITNTKYNLNNIVFTPKGKFGDGIKLFGNGVIDVEDTNPLKLTYYTNYSIELWIKPEKNSEMALFYKDKYYAYLNGSLNVIYNATCNGVLYSISSNSPLIYDAWNYVAITHSSDNITKLYLNGSLEKTEYFNGSIDTSSTDLTIGINSGSSKFNGSIDNFVMLNRTLNASEISNRFSNQNNFQGYIDPNDYIQYKIIMTSEGTKTPIITNATIQLLNHSVYIYDSRPYGLELSTPVNNTNVTSGNSSIFQWSTATDLESNIIYYEFILTNFSNGSNILTIKSGINNFSRADYSDTQTILVEHFDYQEDLKNHGWEGNWSKTSVTGKFKNGFEITQSGKSLRNSRELIDSEEGTIEFFVKPYWSQSNGETNYFFEEELGRFVMNRTGSLLLYSLGASATILTYNISNWNQNEWHHIAVTWKENEKMQLIIDNIIVNSTSRGNIPSFEGYYFYLGSNASIENGNNVFNGIIDEFKVSNVERFSYQNLSDTEFNQSWNNITDGDYYWTTKAIQIGNITLDNEKSNISTNTWKVHLSRNMPTISFIGVPVKQFSDKNVTINFSSSENVFCQYRTLNSNWMTLNVTNETRHYITKNITNFGNFTYYFNCNDSNNNFVNTTYSYYVLNRSQSLIVNSSINNFIANIMTQVNYTEGNALAFLKITTKNNITSRTSVIRHEWNYNPENSSVGLDNEVVAFWTILLDDNLVNNLTGNVTMRLIYSVSDITALSADNLSLYWYNPNTSMWENQGVYVLTGHLNIELNTSRFGTYSLAGHRTISSSATRTTLGDSSLRRGLLRPQRRFGPKAGFGQYNPNEIIEEFENNTNYVEIINEKKEEYFVIEQINKVVEDIMKQTSRIIDSKFVFMIIYLLIIGGVVFYSSRIALALILKINKKNKINLEEFENEIDDQIKYYVYLNINKIDLKKDLIKKGLNERKIEEIIVKVNKLGKNKFENYIYKNLAEKVKEEELVKRLVEKGWEEQKVKEEIEKFKNI